MTTATFTPQAVSAGRLFISCDWGTTAFRLRLLEMTGAAAPLNPEATPANALATPPNAHAAHAYAVGSSSNALAAPAKVLATFSSPAGIAATYTAWQASGGPPTARVAFYRDVLEKAIRELAASAAAGSEAPGAVHPDREITSSASVPGLPGMPVVISGMASSSIGMLELPYDSLPLDVSGMGLEPKTLPPTTASPRHLYLIPGVRSADDVMRGEETQLIGCGVSGAGERVFIFPGTHSKHIRVRGTRAVDFKTYMTGEVFGLLARHSILAGSVATPNAADPILQGPPNVLGTAVQGPPNAANPAAGSSYTALPPAFYAGVAAARSSGLLHNAFLTRTNHLFEKYSKEDNYQFLSGLLIGEEVMELVGLSRDAGSANGTRLFRPITLVASSPLREAYVAALSQLGVGQPTVIDADQALIAGHCAMLARFGATIAP
jgi:2-dehydro-3-deoxygalactonokinase